MANTATVTAKTGPGNTVTSLSLTNVVDLEFDFIHQVVRVLWGTPPRWSEFMYDTIATITITVASGVTTITLST